MKKLTQAGVAGISFLASVDLANPVREMERARAAH